MSGTPDDWETCFDAEHGFALRHPPDWAPVGGDHRCAGFRRGEPSLPDADPDVDVFIRVVAREADCPSAYMREAALEVGRGVAYSDRAELRVGGLPAVRARFRSGGPTPNWGVEYAICKDADILDVYVSRPSGEIEAQFDEVIATLQW